MRLSEIDAPSANSPSGHRCQAWTIKGMESHGCDERWREILLRCCIRGTWILQGFRTDWFRTESLQRHSNQCELLDFRSSPYSCSFHACFFELLHPFSKHPSGSEGIHGNSFYPYGSQYCFQLLESKDSLTSWCLLIDHLCYSLTQHPSDKYLLCARIQK